MLMVKGLEVENEGVVPSPLGDILAPQLMPPQAEECKRSELRRGQEKEWPTARVRRCQRVPWSGLKKDESSE